MAPVILLLSERPQLDAFRSLPVWERRTAVVRHLRAAAEVSMPPVVQALEKLGATRIRPLWAVGRIAAEVPEMALEEVAALPGVEGVYSALHTRAEVLRCSAGELGQVRCPESLRAQDDGCGQGSRSSAALHTRAEVLRCAQDDGCGQGSRCVAMLGGDGGTGGAEGEDGDGGPGWNIEAVHAPELWDQGITGEGVVVGILDSGVDYMHPDIADKWRGGTNSWFDPFGEHDAPHDAVGHGTQAAGIVLGGTASGTPIGVAPDAEWIAARAFDDVGETSLSAIHEAYQWMLDPDGNPETDDAPHVINNSWGFADNPGECLYEFHDDVEALDAAGIAVVFAAGNGGPGANTSVSPANYPGVLSVGAIQPDFSVVPSSARGPSACTGETYPTVAAPGFAVVTSDLTFGGVIDDAYAQVVGTSFSAAHVTGVMALLLSADPDLSPDELEAAIKGSATELGPDGSDFDSGFGLVDAQAAYESVAGTEEAAWWSLVDRFQGMEEILRCSAAWLGQVRRPDGLRAQDDVAEQSSR